MKQVVRKETVGLPQSGKQTLSEQQFVAEQDDLQGILARSPATVQDCFLN